MFTILDTTAKIKPNDQVRVCIDLGIIKEVIRANVVRVGSNIIECTVASIPYTTNKLKLGSVIKITA